MKQLCIPFLLTLLLALFANTFLFAQPALLENKKSSQKTKEIFSRITGSLKNKFEEKKLNWPPQYLYIRSFKYDRLLELWVKNNAEEQYSLFKTYHICMQSGGIGPKRSEGDNQVPEGFYYINEFNPNSNYHLSLGLNYPNTSDKILSNSVKPGGDIYIHGNCVSTGCIAIQDMSIEEVYVIASLVKAKGQNFIPVHIFPVKYDNEQSLNYLIDSINGRQVVHEFILNIKLVFDFFENNKQVPIIFINKKGEYVIN